MSVSSKPVSSARDRLLEAAVELFAVHGFQAIGLRDLANYLGLHAGSLYHHIENKQSLLFELIESGFSDLLLDTVHRTKRARNPRERLRLFIQAFVAFRFNEKHTLMLMAREVANLDTEQKAQVIQLKNRYASLLKSIIDNEDREPGTPDIDNCPMTGAVIAILFGQAQWYSVETTKAVLTETLTTVISGIIGHHKKIQIQGIS